jgi:hypothetical protein
MVTSEEVINMRGLLLGKTIEVKVGDRKIRSKWNDIQINTTTGKVTGVYVGGKLYDISKVDYMREALPRDSGAW